jgi:hypothetical protein
MTIKCLKFLRRLPRLFSVVSFHVQSVVWSRNSSTGRTAALSSMWQCPVWAEVASMSYRRIVLRCGLQLLEKYCDRLGSIENEV